ncbi:MAG: hypothetical protein ACLQBQ_03620 [Smithella sp.]
MAKWQGSKEDEEVHPFFYDRICGFCITEEDINFCKRTGGLIMADNKGLNGIFTYNSESIKYNKFIFEAEKGVMGNIFIPKDIREIPSQIILHSSMKRGNEK